MGALWQRSAASLKVCLSLKRSVVRGEGMGLDITAAKTRNERAAVFCLRLRPSGLERQKEIEDRGSDLNPVSG